MSDIKNFSIGIDLGGTKILTALVNKRTGQVVNFVKKKTKKDKGTEKVISKMIESVRELLEDSGMPLNGIDSIGVGAAGQIDRENGVILGAPNLNCYNLPIRQLLREHFDIPVFLGNDVEIAAIGEMKFGAAKDCDDNKRVRQYECRRPECFHSKDCVYSDCEREQYKPEGLDFVCIFVGTGVGSAIVKDGKIITGATGTAGEIGHMIVDLNGRPCACGAHGCLEAYASRSAIEKRIEGALKKGRHSCIADYLEPGKAITSGMIQKSIEREDELVLQCVTEASEYLSCGIASIINFINPKVIILGGGLIDAVDYFYEKTIKKAYLKCLPVPARAIEFRKAKLGDFSGVIGAAFLGSGKHRW